MDFLNKLKYKVECYIEKISFNSGNYWEKRYKKNGNSGSGSYNKLAEFKAEILNDFVATHDVKKVIEFGNGDGNQLKLAEYPIYEGYDISKTATELCKREFSGDKTKTFFHLNENTVISKGDLTLSLDVIYHLVEDKVFEKYMQTLFDSSSKYVIVYASNYGENIHNGTHVRHRHFTKWIDNNYPNWTLTKKIDNIYPYDTNDPDNTSLADFYFYQKNG